MNRAIRASLVKELDMICEKIIIDYHNESNFTSEKDYILAKHKIIRGAIINAHAYIDYLLTLHINKIIFNRKTKKLRALMDGNKIIKNTNFYLIRWINFEQKRVGLHKIIPGGMKRDMYKRLEDINKIRNILAHSYSFDLHKDNYGNNILDYNGNDIMSYEGISLFMTDVVDCIIYLENL